MEQGCQANTSRIWLVGVSSKVYTTKSCLQKDKMINSKLILIVSGLLLASMVASKSFKKSSSKAAKKRTTEDRSYELKAEGKYCKGNEEEFMTGEANKEQGCADKCYGFTNLFVYGGGECYCEYSVDENGDCEHEQEVKLMEDAPSGLPFKLYKL